MSHQKDQLGSSDKEELWQNHSDSDSSEECQELPEGLKFIPRDFSSVGKKEPSVSKIDSFNQSTSMGRIRNESLAAGDVPGLKEDDFNASVLQSEPVQQSSPKSCSNLTIDSTDIAESPDVLPPQDHPQPSHIPPYQPAPIKHEQHQPQASSIDSHLQSATLHSEGTVEVFTDLHIPPSDTVSVGIQACLGIEISTGPVVIVEEANCTMAYSVRNEPPEYSMYTEISTGPIVEPEPVAAQSVCQASSLLETGDL